MDFSRLFSGIGDTLATAFSARNIPFFTIVFVLGILGTYFSRKVFTHDRAYKTESKKLRTLWKILRDSQVIHPMFAGALWMAVWRDPMDYGWSVKDDLNYGFLAGAVSLFPWVGLKIWLKRKHKVNLEDYLPGLPNSVRPIMNAAPLPDVPDTTKAIPPSPLPAEATIEDGKTDTDPTPPGTE